MEIPSVAPSHQLPSASPPGDFPSPMPAGRFRHALSLSLILIALATGCDSGDAPPPAPPAPEPATSTEPPTSPEPPPAPEHIQRLEFEERANFLLVDDIDRDGLTDIALTSHGGNYTQVFRQTAPRQFEPLVPIRAVGFHPNDFVRLTTDPALFASNAEGESELRLFSFDDRLQARLVAAYGISRPRQTTPFFWPGYGWGAAVVPYKGPKLSLLLDFDQEEKTWRSSHELTATSKRIFSLSAVVLADIDGDAVDELLVTVPRENRLVAVRRPDSLQDLKAEPIWTFHEGHTQHLVVPAHIDGDAHIDLLVVGHTTHLVHLLTNQGDGRFVESQIAIPDDGVFDAAFAVDSDGARYLFLAGRQKFVLMELAAQGAEVLWQGEVPNGRRMTVAKVALRDLDGDGRLDAVVARNHRQLNNAIVYGPLKDHFSDLGSATYWKPEAENKGSKDETR